MGAGAGLDPNNEKGLDSTFLAAACFLGAGAAFLATGLGAAGDDPKKENPPDDPLGADAFFGAGAGAAFFGMALKRGARFGAGAAFLGAGAAFLGAGAAFFVRAVKNGAGAGAAFFVAGAAFFVRALKNGAGAGAGAVFFGGVAFLGAAAGAEPKAKR